MVGNYSITQNTLNPPAINVGDTESLDEVSTGNFLLNSAQLPILDGWSPIKEIRFFCYKPSVGETASFVTASNTMGIDFKNYLISKFTYLVSWKRNQQVKTAIRRLPDDDSTFITTIDGIGIWEPLRDETNTLWNHVVWKFGGGHFNLYSDRRECGDYTTVTGHPDRNPDLRGEWRIYIR